MELKDLADGAKPELTVDGLSRDVIRTWSFIVLHGRNHKLLFCELRNPKNWPCYFLLASYQLVWEESIDNDR